MELRKYEIVLQIWCWTWKPGTKREWASNPQRGACATLQDACLCRKVCEALNYEEKKKGITKIHLSSTDT